MRHGLRALRSSYVRLPVMDIYLVPLGGDDTEEGSNHFEPVDECDNPEQGLLRRESEREAAGYVDQFLKGLHEAVRGKVKQYNRMLGVLWHCYLSADHSTQLEVAASLGVSDLWCGVRGGLSRRCERGRYRRRGERLNGLRQRVVARLVGEGESVAFSTPCRRPTLRVKRCLIEAARAGRPSPS